MFDRIMEYREAQQFRKARQRKQSMRYAAILFAISLVALAVGSVVEAVKPTEATKTAEVAKPAGPSVAHQEEMSEIEEFADIVTKPLDELTSEDLDLVSEKAEDPCYEKNSMLPQDEMIPAIAECKGLK